MDISKEWYLKLATSLLVSIFATMKISKDLSSENVYLVRVSSHCSYIPKRKLLALDYFKGLTVSKYFFIICMPWIIKVHSDPLQTNENNHLGYVCHCIERSWIIALYFRTEEYSSLVIWLTLGALKGVFPMCHWKRLQ